MVQYVNSNYDISERQAQLLENSPKIESQQTTEKKKKEVELVDEPKITKKNNRIESPLKKYENK